MLSLTRASLTDEYLPGHEVNPSSDLAVYSPATCLYTSYTQTYIGAIARELIFPKDATRLCLGTSTGFFLQESKQEERSSASALSLS